MFYDLIAVADIYSSMKYFKFSEGMLENCLVKRFKSELSCCGLTVSQISFLSY